jgi:sugar phosphate isomerase/epimerase
LHLNKKDLEDINKLEESLRKYRNMIEVVHTPIEDVYSIEGLNKEENIEVIEKTIDLANRISENGKVIDVVLHQTLSFNYIYSFGLYEPIKSNIKYLLDKYKNTRLNLENLTIVAEPSKDHIFSSRGSYFDAVPKLCSELRKDLNTSRIGVVWDVCHSLSTIRKTEKELKMLNIDALTLDRYLKIYMPHLNLIHLANSRKFGYGKYHGANFETKEEIILLKYILNSLKAYNYNGKVTLEVQENDYTDVKECVKLDKTVKEII